MRSWIKIRWQFVGYHKYPSAPDEVSFLRNHHRHIFKCSAQISVHHDDRELEFFIVQEDLKRKFSNNNMNDLSCEMICKMIARHLMDKYGNRQYIVEVSEDGENSAIVEL